MGLRHIYCLGLQKAKPAYLGKWILYNCLMKSPDYMQKPDRLPVNEPLMHFPVQYWPQPCSPDTSTVRKDFAACQPLLVWGWTSLWGCVYIYICAVALYGSLPYFIRKLGDKKEGYKGRRSDENIRLPQISPSDKAKLFEASYIPSASWITLLHLQTPPKSSWQLSSPGQRI